MEFLHTHFAQYTWKQEKYLHELHEIGSEGHRLVTLILEVLTEPNSSQQMFQLC